jgi:magnesium-transporting ATPase (P-type)
MILKNTPSVVGCVLYTGHDTKIQMNNAKAKYKSSKIMKKTNMQVIYIFLADILISFAASAIGSWF